MGSSVENRTSELLNSVDKVFTVRVVFRSVSTVCVQPESVPKLQKGFRSCCKILQPTHPRRSPERNLNIYLEPTTPELRVSCSPFPKVLEFLQKIITWEQFFGSFTIDLLHKNVRCLYNPIKS